MVTTADIPPVKSEQYPCRPVCLGKSGVCRLGCVEFIYTSVLRRHVHVGSQVSGNIQKLFVDFNSEVKAGQVVAQIDPALFQAALTQA
jgi:hypothetical protein